MTVVSDTSPITVLFQVEAEHLLPWLFRAVVVPEEVSDRFKNVSKPLVLA